MILMKMQIFVRFQLCVNAKVNFGKLQENNEIVYFYIKIIIPVLLLQETSVI